MIKQVNLHEIRRYGNIKLLEIMLQGLSVKSPNTSVPALRDFCRTKRQILFVRTFFPN